VVACFKIRNIFLALRMREKEKLKAFGDKEAIIEH